MIDATASAVPGVPEWGVRLLAFAVAWTVFISAMAPGLAAWRSDHGHVTLGEVTPAHRHPYQSDSTSDGAVSCEAEASGVACAPSNEAVGSGAAVLHAAGPAGALQSASVSVVSVAREVRGYLDVLGVPLTPPPRG